MNRFRANPKLLAPLLAGLAMLGPFSIDTFFPAFQRIEADFAITPETMQQTISVYLIAYAAMSLFHGPLSDAYGRRGVIVWSLVAYIGATSGCALAPSIEALLVCRGVQGICAGAGQIVGRAIIRDRYQGADAQRLMSRVSLIFAVAPAVAPIVGGWILVSGEWRLIFAALAVFTSALLALCLAALPETLPRAQRTRFAPRPLLKTFRTVFGDRRFLLLAFACALNFAGLWVYIASAPAVMLNLLHLGEHDFGWLFIPTIGGMTIGSQLSGWLAGRITPARTATIGFSIIFAGLAVNLLVSLAVPPSVPWSLLPIGLAGIGVSLTFPTLLLLMLDRFPAVRGAAASVQGAVMLSFSAVVSGLISPAVSHGFVPLVLAAIVLNLSAFSLWRLYRHLTPDATPAVVLPGDPAPESGSLPRKPA